MEITNDLNYWGTFSLEISVLELVIEKSTVFSSIVVFYCCQSVVSFLKKNLKNNYNDLGFELVTLSTCNIEVDKVILNPEGITKKLFTSTLFYNVVYLVLFVL